MTSNGTLALPLGNGHFVARRSFPGKRYAPTMGGLGNLLRRVCAGAAVVFAVAACGTTGENVVSDRADKIAAELSAEFSSPIAPTIEAAFTSVCPTTPGEVSATRPTKRVSQPGVITSR